MFNSRENSQYNNSYKLINIIKLNIVCTVTITLIIYNIEYRLVSKKGEGTFSEVLKA